MRPITAFFSLLWTQQSTCLPILSTLADSIGAGEDCHGLYLIRSEAAAIPEANGVFACLNGDARLVCSLYSPFTHSLSLPLSHIVAADFAQGNAMP